MWPLHVRYFLVDQSLRINQASCFIRSEFASLNVLLPGRWKSQVR